MEKKVHPILKAMMGVVDGIAKTFGRNCEVLLHDFNDAKYSVIAIANGHITGRSVGSPMTEDGLEAIKKGNITDDIINYTEKSSDGRVLKSSTMFIRDENEEVLGCLCINFDVSEFMVAKNVIDEMLYMEKVEEVKVEKEPEHSVNEVLSNIVSTTIDGLGKPVAYMNKDEKVNIVKKLDDKGAFLIKGAIDYVAKVLCVSRYTIYNYLDEIRVNHK
jgi:predicted transcriptional regulator YheO